MPRQIEPANAYRKDYKRAKRGIHGKQLRDMMEEIIDLLANDQPIPPRFKDHALTNSDFRDCHVKPDLVLLYRKETKKDGTEVLHLARLGSHSELFR